VLGLGAHLALSIFGPGYASTATLPLILLLLGYIPMVPRTHYIAVCRARGKILQAAVVLSIGAAFEITGAIAGANLGGLIGLSAGLLMARIVEGVMTAPAVIRASFVHDRGRKVLSGDERDTSPHKERQESDIAELISLTAATATQAPNAVVQDIDLPEGEAVQRGKREELPIVCSDKAQNSRPRKAP
jgi:hypothetical protein